MMENSEVQRDYSSQIHKIFNLGIASNGEEYFRNHAMLIENAAPRDFKLEIKRPLIKL